MLNRCEVRINLLRKELNSLIQTKAQLSSSAKSGTGDGAERGPTSALPYRANPIGFTKELLGQMRNGTLACPEEDINQHLGGTYSNSRREEKLVKGKELITTSEPSILFNIEEPTLAELRNTLRAAQTSSKVKWNAIQSL